MSMLDVCESLCTVLVISARDNIVHDIMSRGESVSHDILSIVYHLPKATSITSAHGVPGFMARHADTLRRVFPLP